MWFVKKNNIAAMSPVGLLHPLPIPHSKWEYIFMDFVMGLSKSNGIDCIFVVVELFVKEVVQLYGVPTTIVSDRDPSFSATFVLKFPSHGHETQDELGILSTYEWPNGGHKKIRVWSNIYIVLLQNNQKVGYIGFIGRNIDTIPDSTVQFNRLLIM